MMVGAGARRYGRALFVLAQGRGETERTGGELAKLGVMLGGDTEFSRFLKHPLIPPKAKKAVLREALGGGFSGMVVNFMCLLSDKRRERLLPEIVVVYRGLVDAAQGVLEVEAQSAVPLEKVEVEALRETIGRAAGKEVRVMERVRPQLLGGLRLRLGDRVLDASLSGGLSRLGTTLREARL